MASIWESLVSSDEHDKLKISLKTLLKQCALVQLDYFQSRA